MELQHHVHAETNIFLQFKVGVMKEVFIGFAHDGFVTYMVQTL